MFVKRLFATKSLEMLHAEMAEDEGRLRRVLGPIGLTSLGIGAIIGAGIFVMTGRVAANDAGPAIVLSFVVAGIGCALAAFCYAEFASMAPVAGSAYTYAYATLGELLAWIIGWDLILEYAMSCATVAASWSKYLNQFVKDCFGEQWMVPDYLCHDPFSQPGAWFNLPAVLVLAVVTVILVIGIRESAAFNTSMVLIKLGVVLFVIAVGVGYVAKSNWFDIPAAERKLPEQQLIPEIAGEIGRSEDEMLTAAGKVAKARFGSAARQIVVNSANGTSADYSVPEKSDLENRVTVLTEQALAIYLNERAEKIAAELTASGKLTAEQAKDRVKKTKEAIQVHLDKVAKKNNVDLTITPASRIRADEVIANAKEKGPEKAAAKWGILGYFGINKSLEKIDDATRNNYMPYGLSGIMLGAALVFFAFIGFDSISTHAEEAIKPQRDVPFGILASLLVCTVLYIAVSAIITGMVPYPLIDINAAIASAFSDRADVEGGSTALKASAGLIAAGGLAGMTSVLLITFLSQARIFLAMARDRLMPPGIFGAVHAKYKTPHISTMITGAVIMVVAAFTPILVLEEMVNIGTLLAFVIVCGAVLLLRIRRPEAHRPFRCPALFVVAPLGILVNVTMMLFLPIETWGRLVIWLVIGLLIYFSYGYRRSSLGKRLAGQKA
jgi:amino acid transporter/polyhydroxyalkanoate synthesis regulator phasin